MNNQELQDQIIALRKQVEELSASFYKNNFSSSQVFNKDITFNTRLRVPVYSSAPSVAEIGDIMAIAGVLYICTDSATPTFTLVGSQS